ncbi:ATP-binding cassette domain-containing protein [Salmonella enterica subsp. enterica serovar Adjame]|nr:ATP-binding cassette domain-containing protein [Salmonella enterica subsp. enterica serovar Adjame]
MLEARDLYCERDERTLFRGLSFTVDAGEWVQVTGGNGAGKTTLLRLLTGLARPDGGEVYWQGEPLRRVRDSFHSGLLWIGHQPGIKSRLTARENLHFFHPGDGRVSRRRWRRPGWRDLRTCRSPGSRPGSSAGWRWPACG